MAPWRLSRLLLGLAGAASVAYLAWRSRESGILKQVSSVGSLADDLRIWLPKLPYLPFIRIEVPASRDVLQIAGDGTTVDVDLPQATARQHRLAPAFRQRCADAGFETVEIRERDGSQRIRCALPAAPAGGGRSADDPARGSLRGRRRHRARGHRTEPRMKHATADTIDSLAPLLHRLRRLDGLREVKPGIFYRRSKAFLHFHEHGEQIYADVRLTGTDFQRLPCTTERERSALVAAIADCLGVRSPSATAGNSRDRSGR